MSLQLLPFSPLLEQGRPVLHRREGSRIRIPPSIRSSPRSKPMQVQKNFLLPSTTTTTPSPFEPSTPIPSANSHASPVRSLVQPKSVLNCFMVHSDVNRAVHSSRMWSSNSNTQSPRSAPMSTARTRITGRSTWTCANL